MDRKYLEAEDAANQASIDETNATLRDELKDIFNEDELKDLTFSTPKSNTQPKSCFAELRKSYDETKNQLSQDSEYYSPSEKSIQPLNLSDNDMDMENVKHNNRHITQESDTSIQTNEEPNNDPQIDSITKAPPSVNHISYKTTTICAASENHPPTTENYQRTVLLAYIANARKLQESQEDKGDDETSVTSIDSGASDDTATHINGSNRFEILNSKATRRDVNKRLDGYKRSPSKHVFFCKAKVMVPESETPTKKMREALGKILTTLLKIDSSVKLYEYMDERNMKFLNDPTQIPETPSKIKVFFHGRYRPSSKAVTIWPDVKIGFNIEPENFFEDVTALFQDTQTCGVFKKDLQAAETEEIGFLLFSTRQHDVKRLKKTIQDCTNETYNFKPELCLRWRKMTDPTKSFRGKRGDKQKASQDNEKVA